MHFYSPSPQQLLLLLLSLQCIAQMEQKYEFFAPIWRVMRDSNMAVQEVKEQIAYVALVTKQASQVSDLRQHHYLAPKVKAPVVYFRGLTPGVCTYFDDRKGPLAPVPHGACWYDLCDDLRVIDVPGDHFSLLRQDPEDMNILITALKMILGPFGWVESARREEKPQYAVSSEEIQDIDAYLQKMGVQSASLRQRLEASMPYASADGVDSALAARDNQRPVIALNSRAHEALLASYGVADAQKAAAAAKSKSASSLRNARLSTAINNAIATSPNNAVSGNPFLVICCDANGTLNGLESTFAALELPVFIVRLPIDEALWDAADIPELGTIGTKLLQRALPPRQPIILAGVGFGGLLAYEISLQLNATSDRVAALALFEGAHVVSNASTSLNWLTPEQRKEVCQIATSLYPTVLAAVGPGAPSLDAFATRLASIPDFSTQLDYIASFKPANEATPSWDKKIDSVLARLSYYKTVAETYIPSDIFPGQTLVFNSAGGHPSATFEGPGSTWTSIRFLIQPVSLHILPPAATFATALRSQALLHPPPSSSPVMIANTILQALRAAVLRKDEAEDRSPGLSALALMSPRLPPDDSGEHSSHPSAFGQLAAATATTSSTVCTITPLNRLCPERRYILRRNRARQQAATPATGGTPSALHVVPLSRVPLWMVHTERGDLSAVQTDFASLLPVPCYGLELGPDADECTSLGELAASYCSAIVSMQPAGPYIVLGTSVLGAAMAHAMVMHMQQVGRKAAVILLDGCLGVPSVPLHDATWYALFYLLREIGTLRSGMGEFVDHVRQAGSPTEQLKLICSFKPDDSSASQEAWDAAVYATLDRAALLKRLMRARTHGVHNHGNQGAAAAAGGGGSVEDSMAFNGPSALILPQDRLGKVLLDASRPYLSLENRCEVHVPLESRHTECLLSLSGRTAAATATSRALRALLEELFEEVM